MILFQFFSSVVSHSFKINWLLSTEKFPRGEWLQKKKIHPVPPIITPLLVIPLPKSSSADLDEPIPFLLVQFHSGLRTGPDPQVWHAPPVLNSICTHDACKWNA